MSTEHESEYPSEEKAGAAKELEELAQYERNLYVSSHEGPQLIGLYEDEEIPNLERLSKELSKVIGSYEREFAYFDRPESVGEKSKEVRIKEVLLLMRDLHGDAIIFKGKADALLEKMKNELAKVKEEQEIVVEQRHNERWQDVPAEPQTERESDTSQS